MGDYLGRSFFVGGDWGVGGFNMFWAPKIPEKGGSGFKSMFNENLRAWTGFNIGVGLGGSGQWSRQNTEIYKTKSK